MKKRVSKKLLFGLGSTLAFSTTGIVIGLGLEKNIEILSKDDINLEAHPSGDINELNNDLEDSNLYNFDFEDNEAIKSGSLKEQINVQSNWLKNKKFPENSIMNLNEITIEKITKFETEAISTLPINNEQKNKLQIKYYFRGSTNPVDKNELLRLLKNYQNPDKFNILQLWNGQIGEKIEATFDKKDQNGNYELVWDANDPRKQVLDTGIIITTVDLTELVRWLERIKVSVSKTGTTINSITFPTIEASGIFNKKEWIKTEQVLELLAIKVHYQQTTSNDWYDEIIGIKRYDHRAQFRIRFFLQKLRGKNLIVKIKNGEQLIGTIGADKISSSVNVNLDVPKLIRIDPDIIHNFRTANNFSGNTKQIEIDQNKLDKLISDLKKSRLNSSLNSIQNAPLQAEFRFGDSGTFKPFEQWKKDLAAAQTDQTTNWIQMIFTIPNASSKEWEVEIPTGTDGTYTALTENNNKVPIYVHDLGIQEGLRTGIQLTGDNANLRITFPRTNGFTVDSSNRISGSKGNGLRIQFSFDESLDVDATTGWLNNRPTSAPVGTNKIFMRIIPVDSWHIYEKKVENQYQKIEVNFQVAQRLTVDSQWINQFQLGDGTIELSGLTEQKINEWISKIQNQVKINNNNLDDTIVKKVSIKFTYKNRTNLDAKQLYEAIRIDRENFANSNLGIVQLWNGTKGEKITARFVGLDNSVIIRDANGNSVVSDVINTNNIYTQIDLSKYVNILKTVKTTVQQGSTLGQMDGFTPPQMSGTSDQFAGKTYEEISNRLKEVGIDIQFANNINGPWQSKENTTTYNPQTAVLYLAFTNQQNNNIKLLIENNFVINAGSNNQNNPIKLILNLPKQITIKNTDLTSFNTAINFSGNTKAIDFDANAIQTLINKILERNSNEANGDQSFKSAPLMIEFKIGNGNWTEWTKLKTYLKDLNTDLTSKAIKYRFKLANNTNSEWSLETNADQERDLFDENNSPLKIYINDNEIFNDLKQTKFNGTNQALEWKWKQGISVDKTSGQLRKNNNIGVGLKIAYSFDQNKWVNQQPTSYNQDVNKVYLKIQLEDPAKFVYDKTAQLIELSLNLPVNVSVEKSWLEQDFITSQQSLEDFITNIQQILTTYEDKVFAAAQKAGISNQIKTKFKIQYLLGENNNLLDQKDLIKKIQNYATENINNSNFGILQLWNNDSGIKIKAQFSDADQSDNFNITVNPNQEAILLNTSKVVTTIDFSSVINWLTATTMKVPIEDGNTLNSINEIKIPQTSGLNNSPFNNREWSRIENVLNYFGITIEYKPDGNVINPIWGSLNSVKVYDPASGQIQFKFKFDKTKSKNLKLKLDDNTIYDGATTTESSIYKFNLKVRLNLLVEPLQISEFIKNAAIGGDTKFVEIDPQAEQKLITSIKEKNALINPEFNNVNLKIEYYLGSESDPNIDWKEWIRFKSDLASQTIDQKSNRIIFKLSIDQSQDDKFSVTNTTYILHNDQTDPSTWGVKYFVNTADLETNASQINVSGTSSKVTWNYGSFGKNKIDQEIQTDGKKIFIKNNYGQRILQVFFSTKENISYDETESNNLNDITSKWVSIEPNHFLDSWKVSKLYIKLVPLEGYVYEAKKNKLAKAHEISLANLKLEIKVDPESLRKPLNLSAGKNYLHELNISDITNFVNSAINTIAINKEKVDVKFRFKNKLLTAEQLLSEIQNQLDINNGLPKNIIQLWNGTSGEKIEAQFIVKEDLKDQYILIDNQNNQSDANRFIDLNTTNIKTLINLKEIVKGLAKLKINVTLPNRVLYDLNPLEQLIMPNLPDGNESELQGLTWNQFETKLSTFGITIEARPKVKGTNNEPWSSISNVQKYDSNLLSLELRFRVNAPIGQNIILSVLNDGDVDVNKSLNNLPIFEMSLKAPAKVVVNNNFLDEFIRQEIFTGDTKYLKIVSEQPESNLIQAIIDENIKNNPDVYKELAGRLEVQYYLGQSDPTQANVVWRSAKELQQFLSNQTEDQITNQIWYRLNIKAPNNENEQIFHIDQSARILVREEINTNAKIKIYINETGFSHEINNFRALGSTDGFTIDGLNSWKAKLPKGLEVGYSKDNNPDETDDSKWTLDLPSQLNNDKKLWLRFKVEEGYVFQNALKDNPKYVQKHAINTEGIKVIIKLKKEWLEQILITGNVKEASINEEKVLELIKNEGILPPDQPDLIELQYNIKGASEWLTKTVFESKLKQMSGAKDSNNFIIKREDLQVRFNIKTITRNDNFGLNIDGQNIEENNRYKFNVDLVNGNRNEAFKGYINLDHLENFRVENFKIIGSTNKPKLIITKRKELDQLFMPYASDDLFDIQFSTTKDANGEWNWNNLNQSILRQGQLIDEEGLITQGIQISANKHFAIRFISKNSNYYDVYKDGVIKNNGYTLDLSNNVQITIEITNPFSADNKTLGLWTRENNGAKNEAKYYQGQGGFKIVVANKNNFTIENNGQISAQQFLQDSNLTNNEKNALEFVFHIFDSNNPSETEIERIRNSITNYDDQNTWKSFETIKENQSSDWSKNLNLKVGNYVAVALRVKKEFATQKDPFVLKDDDYSMILPIMTDDNNEVKKPGRLSGYKVNTSLVNIQAESIVLSNMISSQLPPLDGWTELKSLNLKMDQLENYLGVDLKVQVYTEFYENPAGKILFSGTNTKLVKRLSDQDDANIEIKGNYQDGSGQDISDQSGEIVKIYKDKTTNRLSAPKKNSNATKESTLINLGGGNFRFEPNSNDYERDRLSLFKNQDIDLLLVANKGEGTDDLPDFYLDNDKKIITLKELISPQIKFPVENEKKISYTWNYDEFSPNQIKYKAPGDTNEEPENGNAQIATIYKLIKKEGNSGPTKEISGSSISEAIKNIANQLKEDFDGQLRFETTYQANNGTQIVEQNNDIYQFTNLQNKDRIVLKIVAVEDDLFYLSDEAPLVINVANLTEAAPDQNKLQYLRVKQGGLIDGQGSFKVLVSNPENDNEDDVSILKGWKFLIRVWDKDQDENGNWKIKIPWSDDPAQIKGLANGDKVEWKLVSADGNPVKDAYYNTIALKNNQDTNGNIDYKFAQVNYLNGQTSYQIVKEGIGSYPEYENQYPENSGFVISGLQPAFDVFKIDQEGFKSVISELNLFYTGFDKQGTINIDNKYLENDYWVNTKGQVYLKDQNQFKLNNKTEELIEIPIKEFLEHVTFFTQDPLLYPYQNGFKFKTNDVNIDNHLTNGDQVWAQFDMVSPNDQKNLKANENINSIIFRLPDVNGLTNASDPMSPLVYVFIGLAAIMTLGISSLLAFFISRNKKLKDKK